MNNMINQTIKSCADFFDIDCEVKELNFQDFKTISKKVRGVYVIYNEKYNNPVVYVGKGYFRARQDSHWKKANDLVPEGGVDPKGWKWLRENYDVKPDEWKLFMIELTQETALSAMEGALIHKLQPLANDETFKDLENTRQTV
jgi:hypothetical protein